MGLKDDDDYLQMIYDKLYASREILIKARQEVVEKNSNIDIQNDLRYTAFDTFISIMATFILKTAVRGKAVYSDQFWDSVFGGVDDLNERNRMRARYTDFDKIITISSVFSVVESNLRFLMRELNPNFDNGSTGKFKKIHEQLFLKELSVPKSDFIESLIFFSEIRNTTHNNGIFMRWNDENITLNYKGKQYHFIKGKKLEFTTWEIVMDLIEDSANIFHSVFLDPKVINHPQLIKNPIRE